MSYNDYYPFLMVQPGRSGSVDDYRYAGQGQEQDNEIHQGALSFEYRISDARIGRFLSVDPLRKNYVYNSTYAFSENRVIDGIELEGLEYFTVHLNSDKSRATITLKDINNNVLKIEYIEETGTVILIPYWIYPELYQIYDGAKVDDGGTLRDKTGRPMHKVRGSGPGAWVQDNSVMTGIENPSVLYWTYHDISGFVYFPPQQSDEAMTIALSKLEIINTENMDPEFQPRPIEQNLPGPNLFHDQPINLADDQLWNFYNFAGDGSKILDDTKFLGEIEGLINEIGKNAANVEQVTVTFTFHMWGPGADPSRDPTRYDWHKNWVKTADEIKKRLMAAGIDKSKIKVVSGMLEGIGDNTTNIQTVVK